MLPGKSLFILVPNLLYLIKYYFDDASKILYCQTAGCGQETQLDGGVQLLPEDTVIVELAICALACFNSKYESLNPAPKQGVPSTSTPNPSPRQEDKTEALGLRF